ncbi:MAG TPA: hypothetical protein VFY61_02210 [Pyrinomonadaceae bacterium]|nr:hypothetical protein [Pyrinomonadaceae bacterium]
MKFPVMAIVIASIVTLVTPHNVANYNNTVSGAQTASAESASVAFNLNATGDLPGMLSVTLKHEGGNVNGGTWTLTVLPPNADATSSESGTLTGSFSGGTLTLDANGIATAANSIQLTVTSGAGQFASITSGSGTLNLSADAENSTKLGGPLALSF